MMPLRKARFAAQTILLPVSFEHTSQRVKWVDGRIGLRSWRSAYGLSFFKAAISEPSEFAETSLETPIFAENLPREVREKLPRAGEHLSSDIQGIPIKVLICLPFGRDEDRVQFDPWILRREFLSLKRTTADLLEFLNKYGAWSLHAGPQQRKRWRTGESQWGPQAVYAAEIWADQDRIREALKRGAREWFTGADSSLSFGARPEFPHYVRDDTSCLEAIHTSITVDFLRGVRFRICARKDCGNPFPADRRGKRYCEQYCAHLVSVRKGRKAKRHLKGE
jgi:hypothetical protein